MPPLEDAPPRPPCAVTVGNQNAGDQRGETPKGADSAISTERPKLLWNV